MGKLPKRFLGARIEQEIMDIVERVAEERNVDKTAAIKTLVTVGWKELRLEKAVQLYRKGEVSVDKAAKIAGLTVSEMMNEIAMSGVRSDETVEEYREGIRALLES